MEDRRKILVIDDEGENLYAVERVLSNHYSVTSALNGTEGIRLARAVLPDLVLLDLVMPGLDGVATCHELRANEATRHIPIVMLTGSDSEESRISSFEAGADDFIAKPFRNRELLARVTSKLRRIDERQGVAKIIRCGNLEMNPSRFEVIVAGTKIPLSVLEFNLLKYFVENPERLVTRDQILEAVWRDSVVSFRTVDTHMVSLRKKLKEFDFTIATIYSAGYILRPLALVAETQPEL